MAKWGSWAFAGLMLVVAAVDILRPDTVFAVILWVPVVASATFALPRATGLLGGWALVLTLGVSDVDGYVIDVNFWIRVIGLVLIGLLALFLARVAAQRESLLKERSLIDPVTGLPNRRWMYERLDIILQQRSRDRSVAVLMIDLDGLKSVNNLGGHARSDSVLVELSQRFTGCLNVEDVVHRYGDDEFVIVCPDFADKARVAALCKQLIESTHPVGVAAEFNLCATIGAVLIPPGLPTTSDDAVRQADALLGGLVRSSEWFDL